MKAFSPHPSIAIGLAAGAIIVVAVATAFWQFTSAISPFNSTSTAPNFIKGSTPLYTGQVRGDDSAAARDKQSAGNGCDTSQRASANQYYNDEVTAENQHHQLVTQQINASVAAQENTLDNAKVQIAQENTDHATALASDKADLQAKRATINCS